MVVPGEIITDELIRLGSVSYISILDGTAIGEQIMYLMQVGNIICLWLDMRQDTLNKLKQIEIIHYFYYHLIYNS